MAVICSTVMINPRSLERSNNVSKIEHIKTAVTYWAGQSFSFDFIWLKVPNKREDIAVDFFYKFFGNFNTEQL